MHHSLYGIPGFGFMPGPIVIILLLILAFIVARSMGYIGGKKKETGEATPSPAPASPCAEDDALVILRERFAKGEIDEEEYNTRATVLRADHR